jgi:hypothetical protein
MLHQMLCQERGLVGKDRACSGAVPFEGSLGADNPVRDASSNKLGGGLMHQLPTMDENADAAALTDGPTDDVRKGYGLAGPGRRNVASRPSASDVGGS